MGAIAVKTLVEKIEGSETKPLTKEIILKPELIIRKTCGFHLKGYQLDGFKRRNDFTLLGPQAQ
jgi:hypothetical protein